LANVFEGASLVDIQWTEPILRLHIGLSIVCVSDIVIRAKISYGAVRLVDVYIDGNLTHPLTKG